MSDKYLYAGKEAEVKNAAGVSGMLIKLLDGGYAFRVYQSNGEFTDYKLAHDDLPVTIAPEALASFYSSGENYSLDHSPSVFGLDKVD